MAMVVRYHYPGFDPQHLINQTWWNVSIILALGGGGLRIRSSGSRAEETPPCIREYLFV